ncbi:hypothetical protein V8E55_005048 [Tylopilus felleus]
MPPRRATCVVCQHEASKYTCASCKFDYCSVACYKTHKETCSSGSTSTHGVDTPTITPPSQRPSPLQDPTPLRPLTSLKWPYVPDSSSYPDPLTRDDPKLLQLHQYEAIATSSTVRTLLANPRLCAHLTSIDALRGSERDAALQRALGVDSRLLKNPDKGTEAGLHEDTRALRVFAEAVEQAVRGGREDMLGLDWD